MGLESATYVDDLNTSNPVGASDPKSQGDNHLRLIKAALKTTFPNADHAIYLDTARADVADSGTPDIGAAATNYVNLLGTTTITSFGTVAAGVWRFIRFNAARTLTHNATSLILPGAANITTAASDTAVAVSEGSGNWRVLAYQRASGQALRTYRWVRQVLTASATYTPTSGMVYCNVRIQAPGGGSGGADGVGEGGGVGSGGGAGGEGAEKVFTAAEIGANAAFTLGAVGTAGSNTGGNGGAGGTTTFNPAGSGGTITVNGGLGGIGTGSNSTAIDARAGGAAPTAGSGGDFHIPGEAGGYNLVEFDGVDTYTRRGGNGGNSMLGFGAQAVSTVTPPTVAVTGKNYGGGAAGCWVNSTTGAAGQTGGPGICIVDELVEA